MAKDTSSRSPRKAVFGMSSGVFVGARGLSGEFIVSDKDGVLKTRTIQRRPVGERWPADKAEEIQVAPSKVSAEDERDTGGSKVERGRKARTAESSRL